MSWRQRIERAAVLAQVPYAYLVAHRARFRGAFQSRAAALAAIPPQKLAGYDHEAAVTVHHQFMERVNPEDYPVLYWLQRLLPEIASVIDAGGHIGVKYRAFRPYLDVGAVDWTVLETPVMARAGRAARTPEDTTLSFVDRAEDCPQADVLFGSGLLQYADETIDALIGRLPAPPRHVLLNKVATRDGPSLFTIENFGKVEVPYHMRPMNEVSNGLSVAGYEIVDSWTIPSHAHVIPTHPHLGASVSRGYYARRR